MSNGSRRFVIEASTLIRHSPLSHAKIRVCATLLSGYICVAAKKKNQTQEPPCLKPVKVSSRSLHPWELKWLASTNRPARNGASPAFASHQQRGRWCCECKR